MPPPQTLAMEPAHEVIQNFCSRPQQGTRWAINLEGTVIEIPEVVITEIRANPTHVMGWFNIKVRKAWKFIFPLTKESATKGYLPMTGPLWGRILNSWWEFLTDGLLPKEQKTTVWRTIPQILTTLILCEVNHAGSLSERRMLEIEPIATCVKSNKHITKLVQVFQPTMEFNLHYQITKLKMGILEYCLTLMPGKGQSMEMLR